MVLAAAHAQGQATGRFGGRWVAWWCGLLWCLLATSQVQAVSVSGSGQGGQDLTPHLAVWVDSSAQMDLAQALQADAQGQFVATPDQTSGLAFGFTRAAYWLRISLHNPTDQPSRQMLDLQNALVSSVTLYTPSAAGSYKVVATGADLPFATRAHANRNFVFPLVVPPEATQVVYLRVSSTIGLNVPLQLWEATDFEHHERHDYMLQSWYFGIATAMIVFNLLLFIALHDRSYPLYVSFVCMVVLAIGIKTGMASEFLFPKHMVWSNGWFYTGCSVALALFIYFVQSMLNTAKVQPWADRFLSVLLAWHVVAPLFYLTDVQAIARVAIALFLVSAAALLLLIGWCAFKRSRMAYFFLGAFALLAVGTMLTVLRALGWVPTNILTVDGLQLGSALEMLLLAFALADRYHLLRREKLTLQRTLLQTLRASERTLSQRVQERTLQLQDANEKLEALSMVDSLTGIANRRQWDLVLQREWSKLSRTGQPLALVMLDVDRFKRYNDHYGHQLGDTCLRAVAQAIAGVCRASDMVARYGGEEFVLVAPASDLANATRLAQRAIDAVSALLIDHAKSEFGQVTLSAGVAALVPGPGTTAQALLAAADAGLYKAKALGRNRVEISTPDEGI